MMNVLWRQAHVLNIDFELFLVAEILLSTLLPMLLQSIPDEDVQDIYITQSQDGLKFHFFRQKSLLTLANAFLALVTEYSA